MRTHGYKPLQGYNAQLAVNERQIVIAAELTTESPDFGHLEPMVRAAQRELRGVELGDPDVVLADAGYWHQRQIETIAGDGIQVLVSPDSGLRKAPGRAGPAGSMTSCAACSRPRTAARSTAGARPRSSPCSAS